MKRRITVLVTLTLFALALLLTPVFMPSEPRLVYNPSSSAELGWYQVYPGEPFKRGDLVASQLPDHARKLADERNYLPSGIPVIKTIGAVPGDEICRTSSAVILPDATILELQEFDSEGRRLPQLQTGCFILPFETVFLVSTGAKTSFDSRYIGPVHTSLVVGPVRYIGRRDVQGDTRNVDLAGARALGADCKIKAGSAAKGLTPCLHIIFYSATQRSSALYLRQYRIYFSMLEAHYFTAHHAASRIKRR